MPYNNHIARALGDVGGILLSMLCGYLVERYSARILPVFLAWIIAIVAFIVIDWVIGKWLNRDLFKYK